jgi:hypothetical protein
MNNVQCTCPVSNCKFFGKTEFADVRFILYHLRRHSYNELRFAAIDNKIITTNVTVTKDLLVRELVRICIGVCCQ